MSQLETIRARIKAEIAEQRELIKDYSFDARHRSVMRKVSLLLKMNDLETFARLSKKHEAKLAAENALATIMRYEHTLKSDLMECTKKYVYTSCELSSPAGVMRTEPVYLQPKFALHSDTILEKDQLPDYDGVLFLYTVSELTE